MSPQEALRLNVCETYVTLGKNAPDAKVERGPEHWVCTSSFEHPIANFAVHLNLDEPGIDELARRARQTPHFRVYVMTGDSPGDLAGGFVARGLVERYRLTGMKARGAAAGSECTLLRAQDGASLRRVSVFMVGVFFWLSRRPVRRRLAEILQASACSGHEFYYLEDGQGILAAATLTVTEGVAGLYNVCVRASRRGEGIGSLVVRQLASAATARGLRVVLQCDPEAAPWYARRGFREIGHLLAFSG